MCLAELFDGVQVYLIMCVVEISSNSVGSNLLDVFMATSASKLNSKFEQGNSSALKKILNISGEGNIQRELTVFILIIIFLYFA